MELLVIGAIFIFEGEKDLLINKYETFFFIFFFMNNKYETDFRVPDGANSIFRCPSSVAKLKCEEKKS